MSLNLSTIRTEVKSAIKQTSLTNIQIDRWVNYIQEIIARKMDADYLEETNTFSTVANQRTYYLANTLKIKSIVDQTGDLELEEVSEKTIEEWNPDFTDTGAPYNYSRLGISEVQNQPTSASVITIVCASPLDITQTARVNGVSSSADDTESVILNGGTVATTKTFTKLYSIRKSATTAGKITCTSNATAVTNVVIPPARLLVQHQGINLYPIPTDIRTILTRTLRFPRPMINGEDTPDLSEGYHEIVLLGVLMEAHRNVYEFARSNEIRAIFESEIKQLGSEQGQTRNNRRRIQLPPLRTIKSWGRLPSEF